ncbi:25S rRNA (uracil2634-N3)-methyltransferase, partial [Phenoliferia sp. Uapishka_3]
MGSGKKNKHGGAPKQKGRLQAALAVSIEDKAARARALIAQQSAEDRVKASALNNATGGGKKRRKMVEREKSRAASAKLKEQEDEEREEEEEEQMQVDAAAAGAAERAEKRVRDRKRGTIPYKVGEKVLLVGEGNFSFAHSLLHFDPPVVTPSFVLATSYDTLVAAQEKYPDLMEHVDAIKAAGMTVLFGVDCTNLHKVKDVKDAGAGWDKVVFNFPHVGLGITDQERNVRANQTLILKFLRSVVPFLATGATSLAKIVKKAKKVHKVHATGSKGKRPKRARDSGSEDEDEPEEEVPSDPEDVPINLQPLASGPKVAGTVLITLRTDSPYSLWHVQALATRGPMLAPSILPRPLPPTPQPTYRVVRSFEFDSRDWQGYEHRRTVGFKEGVSSAANEDLLLSARERGEKKAMKDDGEKRREDKELKDREKSGKEKKGAVRTWELEFVPEKDEDDAYD